jgi:hypothetical protein
LLLPTCLLDSILSHIFLQTMGGNRLEKQSHY